MSDFGDQLDKVINEQLEAEVDPSASQHQTQRIARKEIGTGEEESYISRDDLTEILQNYISTAQFKDLMDVLEERVFKPLEDMQGAFK